jgi:dTDP-4-dehydrorhamnose 3,5-epimerase
LLSQALSNMSKLQTEAISQRPIPMEFLPTSIVGLYMVKPRRLNDPRGTLTKIFHAEIFAGGAPSFAIREIYFSTSRKGVVRGLHFQTAPSEQAKLIFCLKGSIFDVSVDLRRSSSTYGQHFGIELTEESALGVLVPEGCAHGMQALVDGATGVMAASAVYAPDQEGGIAWNSCGIAWPRVPTSISEKDLSQPALAEFVSPFP